jgi:hypothetical protein
MSNQKGFLKIAIIVIVLILIGGAYFVFSKGDKNIPPQNITNQNSQPNQSSGGESPKNFGDVGIIVDSPQPNQIVSSPLKIKGYLDDFGDGWEADFGSVKLVDGNGKRMAAGQLGVDATDKQGNYKKSPYYFESTLIFNVSQTEFGTLIFYEHFATGDMAEKFKFPVKFNKQ